MEKTTQSQMATAIKKFPTGKFVIIGILLILAGWVAGVYNTLVTANENAAQQFAQIQNQYQRRLDLIPNLVNTVKGYASFEKSTLTEVVNARANATKVTIDASNLTPENIKAFNDSQAALSGALSHLLAVSENYPNLKANEQFTALVAELAGTENRIAVARMDYNKVVENYNVILKRFPGNVLASFFGFTPKPYFEVSSSASAVPVVQFE